MRVDIANMLHVTDAPPAIAAALRAKATFPNPERAKLVRLGATRSGCRRRWTSGARRTAR
jgi:hypothetical protein